MNNFSHPLIPHTLYFKSIESTMSYSEQHLLNYDNHSLVITKIQTNGRGRKGNQWNSPNGGLWFNLNLKHISSQKGFTLFLGYCITKALNKLLNTNNFQIKWPNDIYLQNKKICGLICSQFPQYHTTLIGVGINTNIKNKKYFTNLNANSILNITNIVLDNTLYLNKILDTIFSEINNFESQGIDYFLEYYQQYDFLKNKKINVINQNETYSGLYYGINQDGALMIITNNLISNHYSGSIEIIHR
ncbi:MAG: biotin--[acetyl-CoA-carboxylase] ligase [Candidatus Cloacimonetes bacterium]|nr:biotin--[acetyl-CoA-carboxylase] ligase [Candidatus Cloacimonadota bacterium]